MKKSFKITLLLLLFVAACALTAVFVSNHSIPVLEPKGMIGQKERELIITASLLMLIVVVPVIVLTWVFAWKYREGNPQSKHAPDWEHNYIAEYSWWGVPVLIVAILAILTWKSSHELSPFKPIESPRKALSIQVVALNWKWLFLYPEQGIATVNFVQFPENTPIDLTITSDAPMNSFWIPQLGGQIYAMPGMQSKLHLIANEEGDFRGCSAHISGTGFAGMTFVARASSEESFNRWVEQVRQSSRPLDNATYNQLVEPSEYHPVELYSLPNRGLFDQIVMKYMMPMQ